MSALIILVFILIFILQAVDIVLFTCAVLLKLRYTTVGTFVSNIHIALDTGVRLSSLLVHK